jgi:hypothetical protein
VSWVCFYPLLKIVTVSSISFYYWSLRHLNLSVTKCQILIQKQLLNLFTLSLSKIQTCTIIVYIGWRSIILPSIFNYKWKIPLFFQAYSTNELRNTISIVFNRISGVMVSVLPSNVVGRGFQPWSGQTLFFQAYSTISGRSHYSSKHIQL